MTHSDAIVDFYSLISEFFQRHLEAASLAVDELVDATGASVDQAAEAILNEHKLFSIGLGADCARRHRTCQPAPPRSTEGTPEPARCRIG